MTDVRLLLGDCLDVMATLPENSIDSIVTDPPYGLSFMGKNWDHGVPGVAFWEQAYRVVKPGAMLLAFGGTRTFHRLTCAIEDAGWEIRDCLMWLYAVGFPKSHDISKAMDRMSGVEREVIGTYAFPDGSERRTVRTYQTTYAKPSGGSKHTPITAPATSAAQEWNGWGTALKPAWEPIVLAMKPLDGTFAQNALAHGVAGLWIDGTRINTITEADRRSIVGSTHGPVAGKYDGWGMRRNFEPVEYHPSGRWPANLLLGCACDGDTHDPSCVIALLDAQSGELGKSKGTWRSSPPSGIYGKTMQACPPERDGEPIGYGDTGGASRFFYVAKASRRDRSSDGSVDNIHPTCKPITLLRYLCRLTRTPRGGIVLDPFMGSGSTGCAAVLEGRSFVGIEIEPEYMAIAEKRIAYAARQPLLGLEER